jgi:3-deoxy-manno-octulosonate cytidylyltransferase (CMP-KDO synthetase)
MVDMKTAILIPARTGSTRFKGKPLVELGGKYMIQRVYDECIQSKLDTYVLTDDWAIAEVMKTPSNILVEETKQFANGTERCADAIRHPELAQYDQLINVQGDMPDISADMIVSTLHQLKHYSVSTMYTNMEDGYNHARNNDLNCVKMIVDSSRRQRALWFGRGLAYGNHHLGIYGYHRKALEEYSSLEVPKEEAIEGLEQLRWLKAGYDIGCMYTDWNGIEINTPEDAIAWRKRHGKVQNTAQSSAAVHRYLTGDLPN